jgi:predicted amidohydrolase
MTLRLTRRGFVRGSGLAAAAGLAGGPTVAATGATTPGAAPQPPPRHPRLPLRSDSPVFALVQSTRRVIDPAHAARDIARNLAAMDAAVAAAQAHGPHKDWVAFHDAALNCGPGTALDRRGPEFGALARLARRYGCWLSVGASVRADQQGSSALTAVAFFSPAGELASLQPAGGAGALGPGLSLVAVTEFGNLAATPRGDEPLLDAERIAAGAEFLLRAHSGPLADWALDVPVCCRAHRIHGAVVSAAQAAATPPGAVDVAAGGTAFYAPDGRRLVCAADGLEQCVVLAVPLAAQRAGSAAGAASGEGV